MQGVIDLFFEERDGGIVLLDYKTDRKTTPDLMRRRYQVQMSLYARAIRRILGKAPKEIYIYRLFDGDAVEMRKSEEVHDMDLKGFDEFSRSTFS